MRLTRRSALRAGAGGLVALLSSTALAGCSAVGRGPSDTPRDWQFDTAAVSETQHRFFARVDHERLRANREHLPGSVRNSVEDASYTPLDSETAESVALTGGIQFGDYSTGSSLTFGSLVTLGSADRTALEDLVRTEGNPEAEREYRGLTLFESVDGQDADGLAGVPGDDTPFTMAAAAVGDGVLAAGSVSVRGRNAGMILAEDVVESTVDAGTGEGRRLHETDEQAQRIVELLGDATVVAGFHAGPALFAQTRQAGGRVADLVTGLRAGGVGVTVEGERTQLELVGVYEDAGAVSEANATDLFEAVSPDVVGPEHTGIDSLDADTEGEAIVVTIGGETRALLDGTALGALQSNR